VLSHVSLAITTLFLIEIPLQLWAFGVRYYNPIRGSGDGERVMFGWLHLFDAAVIVTTFILEVVLKGRERELAGLLILLRLWRLVKLVGGEHYGSVVSGWVRGFMLFRCCGRCGRDRGGRCAGVG
jgi:hypothetical protein